MKKNRGCRDGDTCGNFELVILDVLLDIGHDVLPFDALISPLIAPRNNLLRQHAPEPVLFFRKWLDQDRITLAGV